MDDGPQVPRLILVHGAMHGAWCWEQLLPELERRDLRAEAIDLPGLGQDQTPQTEVTAAAYVERIVEAARAEAGPVVLVGHSMGGTPISGAAEVLGETLAGLVYVAAILPLPGESASAIGERIFASQDSLFISSVRPGGDGLTMEIEREGARACFYHICPREDAERALDRLRPQTNAPNATVLRTTDAVWGAIPKAYVLCRQDRAIPPAIQRWMCERVPDIAIREMDTDHSPFYSDPKRLAEILDEVITGWA